MEKGIPNSQDMKFSQLSRDEKRKLLAQMLRRKASATHSVHPLTVGQQALWFQHQLAPESASYNVGFAARIVSEIDNEAFKAVFATLVDRHPMLRTTYGSKDGHPFQIIHGYLQPVVEIYNASGLCDEELFATVNRKYAEPFDIEKGPVIRVHLFSRTETDHVLLLCIHHIACDGWSIGIILNEFRILYTAKVTCQQPNLLPLNNDYTDFIEMQSQMLTGKLGERLKAYWTNRLSGDIPLLRLPLDRPRFGPQRFVGATHHFHLEKDIYQRLNSLAKQEGVTLYVLLLSAFQTLLLRYSGQDDILVGTPVAGRVRSEYEAIVGFFINQVVMRGDLSGNPSFRQLLNKNRTTVLEAIEHQEFPFPSLVDQLKLTRDPSHYPIFQVLFNLLKHQTLHAVDRLIDGTAVDEPMEFGPLKLKPFLLNQEEGQFDLALEMVDTGVSLLSSFRYNSDIFNQVSIIRIAKEFSCLIESIVSNPDQSVWELKLSLDVELQLNPTEPIPSVWCGSVCERFSEVSRQYSERTAMVDGFGSWDYSELERCSNWVANRLLANHVGSGDTVALYGHRSAGLVLSLMGILKTGAAFLILDPAYPPARLVKIIQVAQPSGLLLLEAAGEVAEEFRKVVDGSEFKCRLEIPRSKDALSHLSKEVSQVPQVRVGSEHTAYLIFTSGTTGEPKGIVGTHGPLSHFLEWHSREFDLNETDRFSMLSGLSHDPLLRDIFTPLWVGGTLCIPDPDDMLLPDRLRDWMKNQQITVAHMTPALGQLLSLGIDGTRSGNENLTNLRYVFFGGDSLTWNHVEMIREIAPAVKCVNFYGATETPQAMGYQFVDDREKEQLKEYIPLGKGIEGVQLLVVNPTRKLAVSGELGEIYVRTPYLTKGYLKDEILTRERYISNPFNSIPNNSDRLYRTGDLGRYLPDGRVMFCGRADSQVSIRGFRVELKEIQAILAGHPDIRDCAVISHDRESGDKYLAAYVVGYDHKSIDTAYLREYLGNNLPDYMIPSGFVQLDELPLTPNGKIDLTSLPAPEYIKSLDRSKQYEPPRYPTEELLVEVWAQVLGVVHVGIHDNFFEVGGHSLMATQIISRISDLFHLKLPLRIIFETLTIAKLAEHIQARLEGVDNAGLTLSPITPVTRSGDLPLSYSQERMWFLQQLIPDGTAYNMSGAVMIDGDLDIDLLKETFQLLAKRHESLRTTFGSNDGQPFQRIIQDPVFVFQFIDLRHLPLADRQPGALVMAKENSRKPFDLDSGPLLRIYVYQIAEDKHILQTNMHHIITDLWSSGILWREFLSVYQQLSQQSPPQLPEKCVDYADFAAWQRKWLTGDVLENQIAYWKDQLAGLQVLELPTDRPRPAVFSGKGARTAIPLPEDLIAQLKSFSSGLGATPFMVLLAVFYILLWRYTGQEDIAIGVPIANRHRTEIEEVVGAFVNTLVLRMGLSDNLSFHRFVLSVRDMALSAYAHQDLPFERLVEELRPSRDPSHSPLAQVMFNLVNPPASELSAGGLTFRPMTMDKEAAQFDLGMAIDLNVGRVIIAEYATDLFDRETVQRVLGHYLTILNSVIHDPDQQISEISFLGEAETQVMLEEWNQTSVTYPFDRATSRLFEGQAIQHSEATAVICGSKTISYYELNRRANQLAHHLLDLGVAPDSFVGIYLERSIDMVVSLLGIMKSGAAYLPLDPAFPSDRIAFMLKDSSANILITQSSLLEALPEADTRIVCIDGEAKEILQLCEENPERDPDLESLAYIIYTSGSTGLPKGVQVSHRALVNFLWSMAHEPGLTLNDTLLAVTTLSFDIAGLELFLPLIVGGRIALANRDTATDGHLLAEAMTSSGATVLQATPVSWQMLIEAGWRGDKRLKALVGGEALPRDLAAQLFERCGELWNMYGPTETTIWSTISRVTNREEPILIGKPIANTTVYILDKHLRPVPIGVPGELYIGGEGLARGYLNRDVLTREKFIPNPFSRVPGERIYATGDLARYRPDGRIECIGRLDHQVKVRGYRIELGEIETALADHSAVNKNVVVVKEDKPGEKRLVAYIVPEKDATISPSEMRAHLKRTLPDYMIPSAFVTLEEFPLTPNGKINRLALPAPDSGQLENRHEYAAPCSPMEETLVKIWKQVLEVDYISVHDNFFEIGGHSLLSMQVISQLEKKIGIRINPRELIYQTLGQLAASLEQDSRDLTSGGGVQGNKNGLWQTIKSRLFKGTT
jgi:amino acid adenylation domain-containing protein